MNIEKRKSGEQPEKTANEPFRLAAIFKIKKSLEQFGIVTKHERKVDTS
jgi:hypothetical protein